MDPSLLRQREAFKNRALSLPVIEKSTVKRGSPAPSRKLVRPESKPITSVAGLQRTTSNKHNFALLAQIVNHMKVRHQNGDTHALTLGEILEECRLEDSITGVQRNWLLNESLINNPKIEVVEDHMRNEVQFCFKPKHNIRDKKALLKLLDRHDQRGLGGILADDIVEGLPKAKKCLKALANKIIIVTRTDKKEIVFYNDKSCEVKIDEEFQKLWRGIAVDSIDDNKIKEYLDNNGIVSVQDTTDSAPMQKRRKVNRKRKFKAHNDHLDGVLKDYSDVKK